MSRLLKTRSLLMEIRAILQQQQQQTDLPLLLLLLLLLLVVVLGKLGSWETRLY